MIEHVVLFRPGAELSPDTLRGLLTTITNAVNRCPTVRRCRVGRRVLHGLPGYEQAMRESYEYSLLLEFDDLQGLRQYLLHPEHARLGELFASESSSLAYDYELFDLASAHQMI